MSRHLKTACEMALFIAVGFCSLFSTCIPEDECTPGTEGCECASQEKCASGLECMSDLCVNPDDEGSGDDADDDGSSNGGTDSGNSGGTDGTGTDGNDTDFPSTSTYDCAEGYCRTVATKCGLTTDGYDWCVNDCESKKGIVPQKCAILWLNDMECGENPDSWVCSGSSGQLVGCQNEQDKLNYCTNPDGSGDTSGADECATKPCCELCSQDCDVECGMDLDCFKDCYSTCLVCCEPCMP